MVPLDRLLTFSLLAFVVILVPGPSVLFVISRALAHGRRTALLTVLGNTAGAYLAVVAVAFGLGPVVERSVVAFTVVKLAGAAYLVYLGVRTLLHSRSLAMVAETLAPPRSAWRTVREGFVVGVTNPKTVVFFAAVLPQFTDPGRGDVPLQILVLGMVFAAVALISDNCWGLAAGTARAWFERSPRRLRAVGGTGGLVMVGLGVGLALTGRKE